MSANPNIAGPLRGAKSSNKTIATKKLIIDEFKKRLRDNIKSLNDNFFHIIQAAKVSNDDNAYKNQTGKMTEFYSTKTEMAVRAQLMVRAADELHRLTTDLKEFLILHDFNFLTHNIKQAEAACEETLRIQNHQHTTLDADVQNMIADIDREIGENFFIRHT